MSIRHALIMAALLASGCSKYTFSPRTGLHYPPKPDDCNYHLVSAWDEPGYEEIGVVEVDHGRPATSYNKFWHDIRTEVCRAGGEVVIAQINGVGWYVRGIVLRRSR